MARRDISTKQAGYIDADFFIHQLFPCSQTADHTCGKNAHLQAGPGELTEMRTSQDIVTVLLDPRSIGCYNSHRSRCPQ
jgi:hypothetical protein